ncbi:Serine/threonine protein kinase [Giardia duodenalis]|uniref:non-specific serine/threonine protein kinase n=1 Tax=Giardia intestinalis TaxID=5741 RepID=V6THX2_GIAIN|nr:Serine/threonine protein kinase [Giardia intestinalis]
MSKFISLIAMPNLDVSYVDSLPPSYYRVLTAVEMGMKNHDYVPLNLVISLSGIRHGSIPHIVQELLKIKLISHIGAPIDGYALTYMGYDYLSLNVMKRRGVISAIGSRIGVGKEADVYMAMRPNGQYVVLKLHKLGRTSFKTAKTKRDYMGPRKSASWMYLSRLAAVREFGFMVALKERSFPVPDPISINRHCVCMSYVEGIPMHAIKDIDIEAANLLAKDIHTQMVRMLRYGIVHGDCNEFNAIVQTSDPENCTPETTRVVIIDFPQVIQSIAPEAEEQFNRDVMSVEAFFNRRFGADIVLPRYNEVMRQISEEELVGQQIDATEAFAKEMVAKYDPDEELEIKEGDEAVDECSNSMVDDDADPVDKPKEPMMRKVVDIRQAVQRQLRKEQWRRIQHQRQSKGTEKHRDNYRRDL